MTHEYLVSGMTCAGCVAKNEHQYRRRRPKLVGQTTVSVCLPGRDIQPADEQHHLV